MLYFKEKYRGCDYMATNLNIDAGLLETAFQSGGYKSKKETVNQALREFIQTRKTAEMISLFGSIEYDADYNYKELRKQVK
jgi:metal-responsive CopG/Arc/MetJ family transcriptional regulator